MQLHNHLVNGVVVRTWMSNYIPQFCGDVVMYPWSTLSVGLDQICEKTPVAPFTNMV